MGSYSTERSPLLSWPQAGTSAARDGLSPERSRFSPRLGIDLIAAFYGCLYAGCVPITVRPPHPQNIATTLPTVKMIVEVTAPGSIWALLLLPGGPSSPSPSLGPSPSPSSSPGPFPLPLPQGPSSSTFQGPFLPLPLPQGPSPSPGPFLLPGPRVGLLDGRAQGRAGSGAGGEDAASASSSGSRISIHLCVTGWGDFAHLLELKGP